MDDKALESNQNSIHNNGDNPLIAFHDFTNGQIAASRESGLQFKGQYLTMSQPASPKLYRNRENSYFNSAKNSLVKLSPKQTCKMYTGYEKRMQ